MTLRILLLLIIFLLFRRLELLQSTMSFPAPPAANIDWRNIGFNVKEVNGHVQSTFSVQTGEWSKPEFVQDPLLRIHGLAPGLNYGQQAYEGLKAHRGAHNEITVFRPKEHAGRMASSADCVSIPSPPETLFLECIRMAVAKNSEFVPPHNSGAMLYIRPVVFGSGPQMILEGPLEYLLCVYVQPGNDYLGLRPLPALILEDFDRAAPNGTGAYKVGGNYAPLIKYARQAKAEGFFLTLHLDSKSQTEVEEFSTSGFIGVLPDGDGWKLIVPNSKNALQSVTSQSCIELAEEKLGWKVEKRPVAYDELSTFSEVIAVGTAASLLPIHSITRKSRSDVFVYTKDGQAGPCCTKLSQSIRGIQQGTVEDDFGWRTVITR